MGEGESASQLSRSLSREGAGAGKNEAKRKPAKTMSISCGENSMPLIPFDGGGVSFRAWAVTAQDPGAKATTNKSDRHHVVVVIIVVIRNSEFGLDWDDEDEWTPGYDAREGGERKKKKKKGRYSYTYVCATTTMTRKGPRGFRAGMVGVMESDSELIHLNKFKPKPKHRHIQKVVIHPAPPQGGGRNEMMLTKGQQLEYGV
jgi:hypothetical protein